MSGLKVRRRPTVKVTVSPDGTVNVVVEPPPVAPSNVSWNGVDRNCEDMPSRAGKRTSGQLAGGCLPGRNQSIHQILSSAVR